LKNGDLTVVFNTESVWHFFNNKEYRDYVYACKNVAIDGVGLKLALRLRGLSVNRFHGPDLCQKLMTNKLSHERSVLVVGGHSRNEELVSRHKIEGHFPLPFVSKISDFETCLHDLLVFIKRYNGRKFILVSLGLPKQELFCQWLNKAILADASMAHQEVVLIPVGAAVDFLSGHRIRSGRFWQKIGLEWLPRLFREPRMLSRVLRSIAAMFWIILDRRKVKL